MIYKIKKDNYKKFDIFKENVLEPRSYFIPFSSEKELEGTDIRDERFNSSMVAVLSGEWDFKYYAYDSLLPDTFDTDKEITDIIKVPSCWQFTGYEKPYYINSRFQFECNPPEFPTDCSVGVYIKKFVIDEIAGNYTITFLGVAPCFDLFINGKYVGYNEGSHNSAEFEINEFLQSGENELVVVVHKWCNGTYLECQDMFRNNGIFRDVYITCTGDNSIYDFYAKTKYNSDGTYILDIIPVFKITDEVAFSAQIFDGEKAIASKSINVCPGKIDKLTFDVLDVEEWSAEIPKLYTLYLSLSKEGEICEIIRKKIGFKHVNINKNTFYFNNKKIKLLGVNHHDTYPKTGYVMTVEDMERDIKICKDYNVNCIRTSHYPPDPIFLDLCDEYGVYVVDEADIECHGVNEKNSYNLIAKNLKWKEHFWDRVYRMFQRDKNHASITMWSLGNESGGYKCHDYCYDNIKKYTDIPIHYEGACRTKRWSYDVHSEMYTWPTVCKKIAAGKGLPKKYYEKPFYLCEYAHAMGVGAGDLEKYVQLFYSSDIMMGGCIWEFCDHAAYHENGDYEYTYGGDHGEWKHDSNFCVDGLFFPDRTPHTGALQMKACYRPIRAFHKIGSEFEFKNYNYFKSEELTVKYTVYCNGEVNYTDEFSIFVEPQKTQTETVKYNEAEHTSIVFEYYDGDSFIAREQVIISNKFTSPLIEKFRLSGSENSVKINESQGRAIIEFEGGSLTFNYKSGEFESYRYKSKELFNQIPLSFKRGFLPSLYRAPLDNDMYFRKLWDRSGLADFRIKKTKASYEVIDGKAVITTKYKIKTPFCKFAGEYSAKYTINNLGEIKVDYEFDKLIFKLVPRLGISIEMPKPFKNIEYFGYDKESLSDFHEHSVIKINKFSVSDMNCEYIKPQESSMRYNTYWAQITDDDCVGLRFESEKPFVFSAHHYTPEQCAKATHKEDLKEYDTTDIHIDGYMLGAGSNACGPLPSKEDRKLMVWKYAESFVIKPIYNGD